MTVYAAFLPFASHPGMTGSGRQQAFNYRSGTS